MNKTLWTSSYVLWTGGWGLLVFGICYGWVDIKQQTSWTRPFELLGLNALIVFVVHVLFLKTQYLIHLYDDTEHLVNIRQFILNHLSHAVSAHNASLWYGVLLMAIMVMLVQCMMKVRTPVV